MTGMLRQLDGTMSLQPTRMSATTPSMYPENIIPSYVHPDVGDRVRRSSRVPQFACKRKHAAIRQTGCLSFVMTIPHVRVMIMHDGLTENFCMGPPVSFARLLPSELPPVLERLAPDIAEGPAVVLTPGRILGLCCLRRSTRYLYWWHCGCRAN
jgi:hypothetical protein